MKQILVIFNLKTAIITALAVVSTYLCITLGIRADFPMTLIATAVVFPIVFSINGAYKRRESALDQYSSIKAHGRGIYFAARDWLEDTTPEIQNRARVLLGDLLKAVRRLFSEPIGKMPENEPEVYRLFSELSIYIRDDLRCNGLASGEVSRCNQFLSKMLIAFETPSTSISTARRKHCADSAISS